MSAEGVTLRQYQLDALAAIEGYRGPDARLVELPTGTGKTLVFGELIRRRGPRALILVHRDELARQALAKYRLIDPVTPVGQVKAERDEHAAPVVIASVQTLTRRERLARLAPAFRTVVVDEAHHAAAPTYKRILAHLAPSSPLVVGVTATPERADGVPLTGWSMVYRRELAEMIASGFLVDLRAVSVRLAGADFSRLSNRGGDVVDTEAAAALMDANAPAHAARAYLDHAAGRRALVFTPTKDVAHAMADAFTALDVPAAAIDEATPARKRRNILAAFGAGDVRVLANVGVLTEGYDEPAVDCIIIARPTRSRGLYVQMIGRATRPHPGKTDALIVDLVAATTRHDLMTAAAALDVAPEALAERGAAAAFVERERQREAEALRDGRLVARVVQLFERRPLHWVPAGGDRYVLPTPDGMLALVPALDGTWSVLLHGKETRRTLAAGLPLDYAQGAAEDHARKSGAGVLLDSGASWRARPATDGQLGALRRWRIRPRPGLTRGEASDLLTAASAQAVAR